MSQKTFWRLFFVLFCLMFGMIYLSESEQIRYENSLTIEQKADYINLANQLLKAKEGTFVETQQGVILIGPNPIGSTIWALERKGGGSMILEAKDVARTTTRIIPPDDPSWPTIAKKFLTE